MFALCSDITIGKFKKVKPHEVKINLSILNFVNTAKIKLPITARIKRAGEVITATAETAKNISEGDKVEIALGYNGSLKNEFSGFVSRVNFTQPLEVECEGYSYLLRKKNYTKTFVNAQLIDVIKFLIVDTEIKPGKNIPEFKIDKLVIAGHSGIEVLEMLKKVSSNTIRIYFTGNVIYAGLLFLNPTKDVKYQFGWNIIKDGNLKLRQAKNDNVTVNFIGEKKDGSKVEVNKKSGNGGGEKVIIKSHAVTDAATLNKMAEAKTKQLSFDGYEGKITAFGVPFCEPGYRAILADLKYQERGGNYIVETTEVSYGMGGFRRIAGIGAKLT